MAQAEGRNSTEAPINDTASRRSFLRHSAAMVAVTPMLTFAALSATKSIERIDPVFAAIEAYRAAFDDLEGTCSEYSGLSHRLPADRRRSEFWLGKDDPRVILAEDDDEAFRDCTIRLFHAFRAEDRLLMTLVETEPATIAGVAALMAYLAGRDDQEDLWDDEDLPRRLVATLASATAKIAEAHS